MKQTLGMKAGYSRCKKVVYKVASQPGYDFDLGYRLLAVCSSHKDLFSTKAATDSHIKMDNAHYNGFILNGLKKGGHCHRPVSTEN
ncbi:Zinc finger MIZ domain-containing protein 1 [Bulinus truncatus]|nr:Zinc finger MIZ domain-containing protein 1 [Bulinus truncatus]